MEQHSTKKGEAVLGDAKGSDFTKCLACTCVSRPRRLSLLALSVVISRSNQNPLGASSLVMGLKKQREFAPNTFLATVGEGRKFVLFPKNYGIFAQGDTADAVFYVQTGKVKLTVVSKTGKEATVGILGEGDFFGEGSLAGQALRMGSATAMTNCALLRIDNKAMMQALHREHALSDLFVAYLLIRNIRHEEDLVDQLFNSSEKRLARIRLLAHFGKEAPETVIPKISQETLAEMVGTTRSRVSHFMNKFRTLGFIDYDESGLQVHSSLLNIVLHD
jgi:CRP/FNR family cyclic AMP-dependent transcriptional regulator